jgi:hypothetical protein
MTPGTGPVPPGTAAVLQGVAPQPNPAAPGRARTAEAEVQVEVQTEVTVGRCPGRCLVLGRSDRR